MIRSSLGSVYFFFIVKYPFACPLISEFNSGELYALVFGLLGDFGVAFGMGVVLKKVSYLLILLGVRLP